MEPSSLRTFWGLSAAELLRSLDSSGEGLSAEWVKKAFYERNGAGGGSNGP